METTELATATITSDNESDSLESSESFDDVIDPVIRVFIEIYLSLSLVCIAANVLIAFVIIKYRRLRQEKSNVIVLNWCIVNTFFMAFHPLSLRIEMYVPFGNVAFCIMEQLEYNFLQTNIIFMEVLTAYWYLKLYHPNVFVKFVNHLKFFICCIYIITLLCGVLHVDSCYNARLLFEAELFLALSYLAFMFFTIIANIVHLIKKQRLSDYVDRKNVSFLLTNTFFLSCVPLFLLVFIRPDLPLLVHIWMICASSLICVMNPVFFFVILYKCDKDYNTFFKHVFRCRCNKYGDEFVEESVVYNNA